MVTVNVTRPVDWSVVVPGVAGALTPTLAVLPPPPHAANATAVATAKTVLNDAMRAERDTK
jgi:hypothetical protein